MAHASTWNKALLSAVVGVLTALAVSACGGEAGEMQILSIEPRVGALQGEQPVRIGGKNFRTDIGYTIFFGNRQASQVTILDPETLMVMSPSRDETGEVDITIRADDGAAFRIASAFRYEDQGGNVVEQLGGVAKQKKGNLAY